MEWYKDRERLAPKVGGRISLDFETKQDLYILIIQNATGEDSGLYTILARNEFGMTTVTTEVFMADEFHAAESEEIDEHKVKTLKREIVEIATQKVIKHDEVDSKEVVDVRRSETVTAEDITSEPSTETTTGEDLSTLEDEETIGEESEFSEPRQERRQLHDISEEGTDLSVSDVTPQKEDSIAEEQAPTAENVPPHDRMRLRRVEMVDGSGSSDDTLSAEEEEEEYLEEPLPMGPERAQYHNVTFERGEEISLSVQVSG